MVWSSIRNQGLVWISPNVYCIPQQRQRIETAPKQNLQLVAQAAKRKIVEKEKCESNTITVAAAESNCAGQQNSLSLSRETTTVTTSEQDCQTQVTNRKRITGNFDSDIITIAATESNSAGQQSRLSSPRKTNAVITNLNNSVQDQQAQVTRKRRQKRKRKSNIITVTAAGSNFTGQQSSLSSSRETVSTNLDQSDKDLQTQTSETKWKRTSNIITVAVTGSNCTGQQSSISSSRATVTINKDQSNISTCHQAGSKCNEDVPMDKSKMETIRESQESTRELIKCTRKDVGIVEPLSKKKKKNMSDCPEQQMTDMENSSLMMIERSNGDVTGCLKRLSPSVSESIQACKDNQASGFDPEGVTCVGDTCTLSTNSSQVRSRCQPQLQDEKSTTKESFVDCVSVPAVPDFVKVSVPVGPKCSREDANATSVAVVEETTGSTGSKTCLLSGSESCTFSVSQSGRENSDIPHGPATDVEGPQIQQNKCDPRNFTVVINKPYIDIISKVQPSPLRSPQLVKSSHHHRKKPVPYIPLRTTGRQLANPWHRLHGQQQTDQNKKLTLSERFATLRTKSSPMKETKAKSSLEKAPIVGIASSIPVPPVHEWLSSFFEQVRANSSPEKTQNLDITSSNIVPPVHEWLSSFFGLSNSNIHNHSVSRGDGVGGTAEDSSFQRLRSIWRALQTGHVEELKATAGSYQVDDSEGQDVCAESSSASTEEQDEKSDDDVFEQQQKIPEESMETVCTEWSLQSDESKTPKTVWLSPCSHGGADVECNNNNNGVDEDERSSPPMESWPRATYKAGKNVKLSEEEITTSCDEDVDLIDWKHLSCILCKKKFNCKVELLRHQEFSNLHEFNLELRRIALEEELKALEAVSET